MVAWVLIAAVQGAQTPVMLELPAQAPCALSTALPLALADEKLVVATSPLTLKVQVEREALAVSLVEHGAVRGARELGFRADDCPVLPRVIAALARAWVDAVLQARTKAPERPAEPALKPRFSSPSSVAADAAFAAAVDEPEPKKLPQTAEPQPPPPPAELKPSPLPPPPLAQVPSDTETPEEPPQKRPMLALDASFALMSRSFGYSAVNTQNLRSYTAPFIMDPQVGIELYPLAFLTKGPLAALGLDGSYSTSFQFNSRKSGTVATWPTSFTHFDVDLRYRWTPSRIIDVAVIPLVGFDNRRFDVGTGTDGTTLDGLPTTSYASVRLGVAGELLLSSGFIIFAKLVALLVVSSGQIISPDYFPNGSNFGFEGQLGIGFRVVGPLQIRLAFDYTHYGMTFQVTAASPYVAAGATDLYMDGRSGLRLVF